MVTKKATDLFLRATREELRFTTSKGELSTEQLWKVPLRSALAGDAFNLDVVAKTAFARKEAVSHSFVDADAGKTPAQQRAELTFDVIKFVIDLKLEEEEEAGIEAANRVETAKLLEFLVEKQDQKLSAMSEKEIRARIEALKPAARH